MIANSRNQVLGRNDDVFNGMVSLLVDARSGRPKRRTSVPVRHSKANRFGRSEHFFRRIANARTRRIRLEPLGPREKVIEIRIPCVDSEVVCHGRCCDEGIHDLRLPSLVASVRNQLGEVSNDAFGHRIGVEISDFGQGAETLALIRGGS
jgi:hypothetical protein